MASLFLSSLIWLSLLPVHADELAPEIPSHPDDPSSIVFYTSCQCQITDQEGRIIPPEEDFLYGIPMPLRGFAHIAYGEVRLSVGEAEACEITDGKMSWGCAWAYARAHARSVQDCGDTSRALNPDMIAPSRNGLMLRGTCEFGLDESPLEPETDSNKNLMP